MREGILTGGKVLGLLFSEAACGKRSTHTERLCIYIYIYHAVYIACKEAQS